MAIYSSGVLIAERYEVIEPPDPDRGIRVGGMGLVYICRDTKTGQTVALKTFWPEFLFDRMMRDYFLEEGITWLKLGCHPNVVRCYDLKYMDPITLLSLELIVNERNPNNASLKAWLDAPMTMDQALPFALQIARGMQHATDKFPGFVHRDLKPSNILVGWEKLPGTDINRVRITDFGLIKIADQAAANQSPLNTVRADHTRHAGTPEYMAPEQWTGGLPGIYTDVYALGCILYEMGTGCSIVDGIPGTELQSAHCRGGLNPLPKEIPGPVRDFLAHCLIVNPEDRYQTWNEVIVELERIHALLGGRLLPPAREEADDRVTTRRSTASSYNSLGISYAHMGKIQKAFDCFRDGQAIYHETGDRQEEGALLGNMGSACNLLGRPGEALVLCEQDLAIAREVRDQRRENIALGNLGDIYRNTGDARRALDYYNQRLTIVRQTRDRRGEGNALGSLGLAHAALGEIDCAIDCYKQQLSITREIGDRRGEGNAIGNLGVAFAQGGERDQALQCYRMQQHITHEIGDRMGEGIALGNLASIYLAREETIDTAIELYEQRLEVAHEIADRRGEANALGNLGTAYALKGQLEKALNKYTERLEIMCEIGDRAGQCATFLNIGQAYLQGGEKEQAIDAWAKTYVLAKEVNLTSALQRLAELGPKVGLQKGLEVWEVLARRLQMREITEQPGGLRKRR